MFQLEMVEVIPQQYFSKKIEHQLNVFCNYFFLKGIRFWKENGSQ